MTTAENIRHHAAGHLAAVHGAVTTVKQFSSADTVQAPPELKQELSNVLETLEILERWFTDPLNSTIERNGGRS